MDTSMPVQLAAEAPRTETENILVEIWSKVLNTQDLDIHADFFSLGGDSLAAMRCINRVCAVFGVELPVDLFLLESASVTKVASEVDKARLTDSNIIWSDGE
jgi:acyl carrier protein